MTYAKSKLWTFFVGALAAAAVGCACEPSKPPVVDPPPGGGDTGDGDDSDPDPPPVPVPARLTLKEGEAWEAPAETLGKAQGLSAGIVDASHDAAGNLWAVDKSHVYVRRAGLGAFEKFGVDDGLSADDVLSVGGAAAGVAWVGHRGVGGDEDDPDWMRRTGGVDRVTLDGADVKVSHFELASPPGRYSQYPNGRYMLRSCYRVYATKTGRHAGNVWFGCNHGVAAWSPRWKYGTDEHHHPLLCVWDPVQRRCTDKAGDVPAVAHDPDGGMWFGGTYGVMKLDFDSKDYGNFWGAEPVHNLSLWEKPLKPNAWGSEDVAALAVAKDGSLWAASRHSGLANLRPDGTAEYYQQKDGLPENALVDLAVDRADGLWIATARSGVVRLDLATGEWRRLSGVSAYGQRVVVEPVDGGASFVTVVAGHAVALYPEPEAP